MSRDSRRPVARSSLRLLPLLLVAALGGCGGDGSQQRLARSDGAVDLAVALAGDGRGVVVYERDVGKGASRSLELWLAEFTPDDGFAPAQQLSFGEWASGPEAVLAADGTLHAAWVAPEPPALSSPLSDAGPVTTRIRRQGSGFEPPVELDSEPTWAQDLHLAGDRAGSAIAAWDRGGVVLASVALAGSDFTTPQVLHDAGGPFQYTRSAVAMNGGGVALLAWSAEVSDDETLVAACRFDSVSGFVPLGLVGTAHWIGSLSAAIAEDGTCLVAWAEAPDRSNQGDTTLRVRRGDGAGAWLPVETLAVAPPSATHEIAPDARFAADGRAFVAWSDRDTWRMRLAIAPAGGSFEVPIVSEVGSNGHGDYFGFAVEPAGRATLLAGNPEDEVETQPDVGACRYDATGGLTPTFEIAPPRGGTRQVNRIEVAADGELTLAAWIADGFVETFVWRAPLAGFIADPAVPSAGVAATFTSNCAVRTWFTSIARVDWDFDDDGLFEQAGAIVAHAFPMAGSCPVTMRATDGWGEVATWTESVTVGAGGGGPSWELTVALDGAGSVWSDSDEDGTREIDAPGVSVASFPDGEYVFLQPEAPAGFHLDHWEGLSFAKGDGDYGADGCVVHMTSDRAVKAVFVAD